MLAQRGKQAEKLLFEGALPQQVDAVVTKFGMPMGPFAMGDLAGLDIGWRSRKDRGIKSEIADALCEAGRFGQKTGKGYYKYESGLMEMMPVLARRFTSPIGRGRIAFAIRVRGCGISIDRTPSPQPSPHGRGGAPRTVRR